MKGYNIQLLPDLDTPDDRPIAISCDGCSILLSLKNKVGGDFRREVIKSALGGEIMRGQRSRTYVRALNTISLKIYKGERIGVIGSNGSGKTTFLKMISGAYLPQEGTLKVQGKLVSLLNLGYGLESELSAYENIPNLCIQFGLDIRETQSHVKEILKFSDLGEFFYQPVKFYSSGMRMRLLLAVATLQAPEVLVMDEWFGTGDVAFRSRAEARINKLMEDSGTLVLASHSMPLIRRWTERTLWLYRGNIQAFGPTDAVVDEYLKLVG